MVYCLEKNRSSPLTMRAKGNDDKGDAKESLKPPRYFSQGTQCSKLLEEKLKQILNELE